MFCSKCGRQFPDGSVCPCQQAAPAAAPRPAGAPAGGYAPARPAAPAGGGLLAKFTLGKVIAMFITVLTFGLSFINWYKIKDFDDSGFGPYAVEGSAGLGDMSWLMVVVQILLIINIVVFAAYLVASVINIGALVPAVAKLDLGKLLHKAFYFILAFCLILGFIGALSGYVTAYDDKDDFEKDAKETVERMYEYEYRQNEDVGYNEKISVEDIFKSKDTVKEINDDVADKYEDADKSWSGEIEDFDDYVDAMWDLAKTESTLNGGWYVTLVFTLLGLALVFKPNLFDVLTDKVKAANAAAMAQSGQPYPPRAQ